MTIIVSVVTPDGIAMGADSRTIYMDARQMDRIGTDTANKLFAFGADNAISTAGWAFVNGRTISSHVGELDQKGEIPEAPFGAAEVLAAHFKEEIAAHVKSGGLAAPEETVLTFHVGGFDAVMGRLYRVDLPDGDITEVYTSEPARAGVTWNGQTEAISRLLNGIDPRIPLADLPSDAAEAISGAIDGIRYRFLFGTMTLQDAVDLCLFLMQTTVSVHRFTDGVAASPGAINGVGGPLDVLAISRTDGLKWVRRKELTA